VLKKDVLLLPLSFCLGPKWGQKQGLQVGLRCACAKANRLCFRPHLGDEILVYYHLIPIWKDLMNSQKNVKSN
jgi:hypothetical protein